MNDRRTVSQGVSDPVAGLLETIRVDAAAGRFDAWGASTVVDELLDSPVLTRADFDALHAAAGLIANWPVGNAGLLHVYGYLLSDVETPFGRKSDRWLQGHLAAAFGLPAAALLPGVAGRIPTPLETVTSLISPLLQGDAGRAAAILDEHGGDTGETASWRARSVLAEPTPGRHVLVYAVASPADGPLRPITLFPVDGATFALRPESPPRLRYNAALPA